MSTHDSLGRPVPPVPGQIAPAPVTAEELDEAERLPRNPLVYLSDEEIDRVRALLPRLVAEVRRHRARPTLTPPETARARLHEGDTGSLRDLVTEAAREPKADVVPAPLTPVTPSRMVIAAREDDATRRPYDRAFLDALGKDPDDATDAEVHRARDIALRSLDREVLGRIVREVWIAWAKEQPTPKPSWLIPWEGLSEPDREADRRIGERTAREAPPAVAGHDANEGLGPEPGILAPSATEASPPPTAADQVAIPRAVLERLVEATCYAPNVRVEREIARRALQLDSLRHEPARHDPAAARAAARANDPRPCPECHMSVTHKLGCSRRRGGQ